MSEGAVTVAPMKCFDLASGKPCKGLEEIEAGVARDKVELAAVLVGAVAGVRAAAGPHFPDKTSEAWQALERHLEAVTKSAATLAWRLPRIRDQEFALTVARGLDLLLCNIVVGFNALELAIGDGLAALETGGRASSPATGRRGAHSGGGRCSRWPSA